ncbi:MAG TPA: DUF402 domain-containing protein [Ktedonobacterales bacterium]|jgi:predicted RNA-binding protein associated with RNAse of E/G family|nr:DUF402 domain-containing protein [Ktedonobacterales bacterium]
MKRTYGNRPGWSRILKHTFTVARVGLPAFNGFVTLYTMIDVREPLYKPVAGDLTLIADTGFHWLQLYSADAWSQAYTVTAAFDPEGSVVQWYIDVCAGHEVDSTRMLWHDDLDLDLVVSNQGAVAVIDVAELELAVDRGETPVAAFHQAWSEVHRLAPLAHSARLPEMRVAREALQAMRALERGVSGCTCMAMLGAH